MVRSSSNTSSLSLSGLGDSMWNVRTRETEGELDDPLKPESTSVLLCMILKDGHFVALQKHNKVTHSGGGVEGVTLRDSSKGALLLHNQTEISKEKLPPLQITIAGELEREKSP